MRSVLHNNNFFKDPYYFVRRHQKKNFNEEIIIKIAPSNPNLFEFDSCKRFGTTRLEGIWNHQVRHGK